MYFTKTINPFVHSGRISIMIKKLLHECYEVKKIKSGLIYKMNNKNSNIHTYMPTDNIVVCHHNFVPESDIIK